MRDLSVRGGKVPITERFKMQDIEEIINKDRRCKRGRKQYQQLMENTRVAWKRRNVRS